MKKLIGWCKQRWLLLASCFLVAFIPLYPKLPLFDIVQTWVYIRFEDLLVAIVGAVFVLMLWRRKLFPATSLTTPILVYWGVGLVSLIFSILFIGPKLLEYFPHLAFLHYIRRLEYMALFFIGYYALFRKPANLHVLIWTLGVTVLGIIVYGVGQKFLGFPAYLTMNEEFAKGLPLRLPPTARIASTFGGHYDLGAYLVMVIPIFGSLVFGMGKLWQKLAMFLLAVGSLVLLLFTASRISFLVYLVAISAMLIWKKKPLFILPVVLLSFVMLNFVSSASERFYKTFRFSDVIVDLSTGQPIGTLDELEGNTAKVETQESPGVENLPKGSGFIGVATTPTKPSKNIKTIEYITSSALATGSGEIATISGSFLIQKAFVYDISLTTRFQGQWPKAIEAFNRNIFLGSGYSTLSVASDGDYLRMLGETGIIGTIAFLGIFLMAFSVFLRDKSKLDRVSESFVVGMFAGLVGIFLNAILIDVFEASKVAFSMWLLLGAAMAVLATSAKSGESYTRLLLRTFTSRLSIVLYIGIAIFVIYGSVLSHYFIGDDFTWLRWAASAQIQSIGSYFTDAGGFFYRPLPKILYQVLYSVFWLKPQAYHVVSVLMFFWLTAMVYTLLLRHGVRAWIAFATTALFIVLSVHHEIVFWISTFSHAMSAGFLFTALLVFDSAWKKTTRFSPVLWLVGTLLVFASALSYEGGSISGLVVVCIGVFLYGVRSWAYIGVLATTLLYWVMRSQAGAVGASGDYGVRPVTFVVNSFANCAGYLSAILFGPKAVELFAALRQNLRQHILVASVLASVAGVIIALKLYWYRHTLHIYQKSFVWIGASVLSMVPFLGLGGISERYALVPSAFFILALGCAWETAWATVKAGWVRCGIAALVFTLIVWNYIDLRRVSNDWKKASSVSETTILALKANYFPLQDKQAFVFVDTPIRLGRAWIFPTGLDDALWHMFKFNGHPYRIYTAASTEEAFKVTSPIGTPIVLVFDGYTIKLATREVKTIEVDEESL